MKLRAYIYHKRAEKYSDCQDCFGINPESNRVAISDGMSQSIYPQWWAEILVDAYLEKGTIPSDITRYQKVWQEKVNKAILMREALGKNPWRLKNSVAERSGAGATLCGLTWLKDEWRCECLGDSCLIAVTKNNEIKFHTSQVGNFGNHPDYYDSFGDGKGKVHSFSGNFNEAATLLLVTDPFSELFQKHEAEPDFIKERINEILNLSDHQSFVTLVEVWRDKFDMHNDDSTLIILNGFESAELDIIYKDDLGQLCKLEQCAEILNKESKIIDKLDKEETKSQVIQEKTLAHNESPVENREINTNLIAAFKDWLCHYSGKMKDGKVKDSLWSLVYPIVKDFIKKNKNK